MNLRSRGHCQAWGAVDIPTQAAAALSDPRRTEAPDFREMWIVRDHATPEAERRGGDHAVRNREIPMHALQKPCLARQVSIERCYIQARVFKGPELGQDLGTASLLTNHVHYLCDYDGRKDSSPFPAERG